MTEMYFGSAAQRLPIRGDRFDLEDEEDVTEMVSEDILKHIMRDWKYDLEEEEDVTEMVNPAFHAYLLNGRLDLEDLDEDEY